MLNIETEKKMMKLLRILDSIEKYIMIIPEPFEQDIDKYKHAMSLMHNVIGQIVNTLEETSSAVNIDPYLAKLQKDMVMI